jgi:FkbM family methyltransferase
MLKKAGEWWVPKSEVLGLKWFDNPRGERPEVVDAALRHCTGRHVALDVGAHVGTWAVELSKHFERVHCFEPSVSNWLALAQNLSVRKTPVGRTTLWLAAVGDRLSNCITHFASNASMSSYVKSDEPGGIPMIALDDIQWGKVSLIKIDVEGLEYHVLRGAERLIETQHPMLVIEWKDHRLNRWGEYSMRMEHMLSGWGYRLAEQLEIDRIYV